MTIQIKDLTAFETINMSAVRGGFSSESPIALRAGLNFEPSDAFAKSVASDFTITKTLDRTSPHLFA
jgi:hypothetical protein